MKHYVVLYRTDDMPFMNPPLGFVCQADNTEHAEEQFANEEVDGNVVWVYEGPNWEGPSYDPKEFMDAALQEYWGGGRPTTPEYQVAKLRNNLTLWATGKYEMTLDELKETILQLDRQLQQLEL